MKLNPLKLMALIMALTIGASVATATNFGVPKQEFRSAWVATVWQLDWPTTNGAQNQKAEIDRMLDSLKNNNFNAVNFQVRSMCDAMYQSSIEPWSSYLTGTRGADPGYDPLQYVVEACHQRGMECHAWVNPYRWSTGSNWNTAYDQELKNDGWLLTYGSTIILDPGQQRTIDRIVAVCHEIVANYDVDGILYDDYFYPNGIPTNSSAGDYQEWIDSGTTMSMGDWRRDNVNRMVKAVYDMIQETKPWVRFGISPAGVACTSASVAAQYGVEPSSGSDWQYNGIFSDPLAWYQAQTVDYMSPQIYWHIGNSAADYGKLAPWWNKVAKKFGRHMFVSHSISSLTKNSYGSENPEPSMTSSNDYDEYANQVELMRTTNEDNAPGSIYYSCHYLYRMGADESFSHYLGRVTYTRPALPPAMPWKTATDPGRVRDLNFNGQQLSWNGYDNVRYTVYAFPNSMAQSLFNRDGEFLIDMTYDEVFTIPEKYRQGYQFAVCVLDRVGNEYAPVIFGEGLEPLPDPTLVSPEAGASLYNPFDFVWNKVEGAQKYILEIAQDASFDHVTNRVTTTDTIVSSASLEFRNGVTHYWRVQSSGEGYANGVSLVREIVPLTLVITHPYDGQQAISTTDTIRWNAPDDVTIATLRIATNQEMTDLVFTGTSANGELAMPEGTLNPGTKYYANVTLTYKGLEQTSPMVAFITQFAVPSFILPIDGGVLYGDQHVEVQRQSEALTYVVEISHSATVWGRTRFVETLKNGATTVSKPANEIKVNNKLMEDGTTYYARVKMSYLDEQNVTRSTDYGDIISFTYKAEHALAGDVNGDGRVNVSDVSTLINMILGLEAMNQERADVNGDGRVNVSDVTALINIILGIQ